MIRRGLRCDECLIEAEYADGVILAKTGAEAREQARKAGWLISRKGDWCPDCVEEMGA